LLGASETLEVEFKGKRISSLLAAVPGATEAQREMMVSEELFGYRAYAKQVVLGTAGSLSLGSYVAGTHLAVDNQGCPVLAEPLPQVLRSVEQRINEEALNPHGSRSPGLRYVVVRTSMSEGTVLVTLVTSDPSAVHREKLRSIAQGVVRERPEVAGVVTLINDDPGNVILTGSWDALVGNPHIYEEMLGFRHRLGPKTFFQINPAMARRMFELALDFFGPESTCVEGFCGVGAMTLPLSRRFGHVAAIDNVEESIASLMDTMERHGVQNVQTVCGDAYRELPLLVESKEPSALVLDPPRKGLGGDLVRAMGAQSSIKKVALLACDPKTLAADVPLFVDAGFRVSSVVPVNQFARTAHVEAVCLLER
jgi:23S rRNA (uracil1939-C5)-methyltransferase